MGGGWKFHLQKGFKILGQKNEDFAVLCKKKKINGNTINCLELMHSALPEKLHVHVDFIHVNQNEKLK